MAEAVTPDTIISWFTEYQKNHIVKDGVIPKWFHGIISRKQVEEMLITKPPGCFLIRVSESRIGYTLSYRAEDLCRHFMIDILPGNQCEIVGENLRHCSLHDLVAFHSRTPICPYTQLLTEACDQAGENISVDSTPSLPALCRVSHLPFSNQNLSNPSAFSISSTRLYPSLQQERSAFNTDNVESSLNLSPKSRQNLILPPQEINTRCHSSHARIRLIQCKKIFKKKKKLSEEHVYMEINKADVTSEPAALQTDTNSDQDEVIGTIPAEYLNPPPFAPGF